MFILIISTISTPFLANTSKSNLLSVDSLNLLKCAIQGHIGD